MLATGILFWLIYNLRNQLINKWMRKKCICQYFFFILNLFSPFLGSNIVWGIFFWQFCTNFSHVKVCLAICMLIQVFLIGWIEYKLFIEIVRLSYCERKHPDLNSYFLILVFSDEFHEFHWIFLREGLYLVFFLFLAMNSFSEVCSKDVSDVSA